MSFRPMLAFAFAVLCAIGLIYIDGPALMRDVKLRNAALVPARDLKVEEAKCTAHWWIVSSCSVSYTAPQLRDKQSIYFTVFGTLGGQHFQLMRGPDQRTVTTDIGIAKLANRIAMTFVLLAAFAMMAFVALRKAVAQTA